MLARRSRDASSATEHRHEIPDQAARIRARSIVERMTLIAAAPGVAHAFHDDLAQQNALVVQIVPLAIGAIRAREPQLRRFGKGAG